MQEKQLKKAAECGLSVGFQYTQRSKPRVFISDMKVRLRIPSS